MFKKQIDIVESNSKPDNKHDWWFDTKNNKLKRYSNGVWKTISSGSSEEEDVPEVPEEEELIKMPPANELWFLYEEDSGIPDEEWFMDTYREYADFFDLEVRAEEVKIQYGYYSEVLKYGSDDPEDWETYRYTLVKVIFDKALPSTMWIEENDFMIKYESSNNTYPYCIWAKLPTHINKFNFCQGILITDDNPVYYFSKSTKSISGVIFGEDLGDEYGDYDGKINIVCLAVSPPDIEYVGQLGTVFVPPQSVDSYKKATNWSECNIKSIEQLPEICKA